MMPHIICLLLIASSPIHTLGDGPESWGSLPSESECRPYIEKALQGAAHQPTTDQPTGIDDVGDTGQGEEKEPSSEASEIHSSENPSDVDNVASSEEKHLDESIETTEVETKEESSGEATEEDEINNKETSGEAEDRLDENNDKSSEVLEEPAIEDDEKVLTETSENDQLEQQSDESTNVQIDSETTDTQGDEALETESKEESNEEVIESSENENIEPEALGEKEASSNGGTETEDEIKTNEEGQTGTDPSEENSTDEETVTEKSSEDVETATDSVIDVKGSSEEETSPTSLEATDESNGSQIPDETVSAETEPIETSGESGKESDEESVPTEIIDDRSELLSEEATEKEGGPSQDEVSEPEDTLKGETQEESVEEETPIESSEILQNSEKHEGAEDTSTDEVIPTSTEETSAETTHQESQEETANQKDTSPSDEISTEEEVLPSEGEEAAEPAAPEEELSMIIEVPEKLRSRDHMAQILLLNEENEEAEGLLSKTIENTLRELKKLYDTAIKPLEILYKYRDLSNRHFGDPEIFSKPLILFMGPWSGGKSTIINYLLENEYKRTALRSGAEPSPAYFNIVMWGEREEVLDGTQLAADWTFSGLQKFGQGLLDRLRGLKLNHPLLQKVNIVEIPGILEIRKQVERLFPFNDACQWFIDRADIIFLVYDPSKLDVGPETEAILDQLKGREMQTRIILNKADQVKPEELMRVQGTLIWNISPLMSSTEPPVMYSTSLWSLPYETGAPTRLLYAQERAFLKDLRDAVDKRVENKIASARRFAVRVRNHAKMVDCYLTTYYNHKSFFGNKKKISDDIIEHPQNYHIYEGLSTLTNISRYDLPDPDVYRDFFRLNPVYEFQQLSSTCTYFRGCPINRLDVAIAYDLPELVGKYKKQVEEVFNSIKK